jgi:hypothetical protein
MAKKGRRHGPRRPPVRVFISYSNRDAICVRVERVCDGLVSAAGAVAPQCASATHSDDALQNMDELTVVTLARALAMLQPPCTPPASRSWRFSTAMATW